MGLVLMIILGLMFGSFVSAAVWRIRIRDKTLRTKDKVKNKSSIRPNPKSQIPDSYSVLKGRSMCPNCRHQLAVKDLIPIASWLWLKGKCRYCHKPISVQYPLTELFTAGLFSWSYLVWDFQVVTDYWLFGLWLMILTGLVILIVYDLRWMELPHRVIYPLMILAGLRLIILAAIQSEFQILVTFVLAGLIAGGFFFALFFVSGGRWLGGGDVKLAFLMGLLLGGIGTVVAMFLAFNVAAVISLGLIASKILTRKDLIPFGPFLIGGTIVALLHGPQLINTYINLFTP